MVSDFVVKVDDFKLVNFEGILDVWVDQFIRLVNIFVFDMEFE